jgi:ribosomal protein S18 acetylase RimI-like enzyme
VQDRGLTLRVSRNVALPRETPMRIAVLAAGDARPYRALMLHAYEHAADAFTSTVEERAGEPESWWVGRIDDPTGMSVAFGAFEGTELVGAVALAFSAKPKTKHKASLIGMYVMPQWRGSGAARALLQAAIGRCRSRGGIRVVQLTVTEGNEPAVALYRSAGFRPFGTEPMAVRTPAGFRSKVHMWLDLSGIENAANTHHSEVAMDIEAFMQGYKAAWEARDPAMFAALFHADGRYHNTPFQVQRGAGQLREYWQRVQLQEDVEVAFEVLASTAASGIAHWRTTYQVASEELFQIWAKSTGTGLPARKPGDPLPRMVLDGILQASFSGGLCAEARIWWHSMPQTVGVSSR